MQYALINEVKSSAKPNLKGLCTCCLQPVIAKCGTQKIWHWSHLTKKNCDVWWETETEWHRKWKNQFDISFQEIVFTDKKSGEKHIADICLSNDLVIEFQHSPILPEEQLARETFYKNMIWVVDGTRLKNDFKRFIKGRINTFENTLFYETEKPKIFKVQFIDWCLPNNWLKSSVPVLFDFYGDGTFSDFTEFRKPLYCVFPFKNEYAVVAEISRETFVNTTKNGEWSDRVNHFMKSSFYNEIVSIKNEYIPFKKQQRTVYTINGIPLLGGKRTFMRQFKKK